MAKKCILNCRWSAAWKSASSHCSTCSILLPAPASPKHRQSASHTFPRGACTERRKATPVLRLAAWGAWLLGFLPSDFPMRLLQEAALLFSQRRPKVRREEKAAGNEAHQPPPLLGPKREQGKGWTKDPEQIILPEWREKKEGLSKADSFTPNTSHPDASAFLPGFYPPPPYISLHY